MIYEATLSRKKEIGLHIGFWLLLAYFTMIEMNPSYHYYFRIGRIDLFSITIIVVFMATFYFNYLFVLPCVFDFFKWKKVFLGIACAFLFFISLRFFIEQFLTVILFGEQNYFGDFSMLYYFFDNLYFGSFPIIGSTIVWLTIFVIHLLKYNQSILEEQKNTEIKFLKAQINPHFIFNTLNNIYSMVYFQSSKSLSAIEGLSKIMRFTTYESQKEKVRLTEEINYIQAYIELDQLGHQEDSFVELEIEQGDTQIEIPPYILSPLVENALKHGVTSNEKPIEITLTLNDKSLKFTIKNEISKHKKDKLGGIGLENLKKRLEIYYPKTHKLSLTNENNTFTAHLEIELQ